MKKIATLWICIVTLIFISGCGQTTEGKATEVTNNPYKKTAFMMGTVVTIKIYDNEKEDVLERAFNRIKDLESQITVSESGSEIEAINENAGIKPVEVSADIYTLVESGKKYSQLANGSFDISIGPLTSLWRIGYDDARKPEPAEIDEVLPLINFQKVELNKEEQTVFLMEKGMKLDLGAIAKGFITDEVVKLLNEHEVETAIIDLGGNIYVKGHNPSGEKWKIGIQNPFSGRGEIVGKIAEVNKSVVTSGVYERYLEVDDTKYHHLLNPKDGYPFMNDIAGVTVVSEKSIDGDALSTTIFSKGIVEGIKFIEEIDGVEAIFVSHDRKVYTTSGLKNKIELVNDRFELED